MNVPSQVKWILENHVGTATRFCKQCDWVGQDIKLHQTQLITCLPHATTTPAWWDTCRPEIGHHVPRGCGVCLGDDELRLWVSNYVNRPVYDEELDDWFPATYTAEDRKRQYDMDREYNNLEGRIE